MKKIISLILIFAAIHGWATPIMPMMQVSGPFFGPVVGAGTTNSSQVATPTFSPVGGTYSSTQTVTISTSTGGATICYTTDGSTPTETAHVCTGGTTQTYTTPISVSTSQTVKALGTLATYTDSSVGSATYTISGGSPTVSTTCYQMDGSTSYTTAALNTTGAEFIAFAYGGYNQGMSTVTDNKSNGNATLLTVNDTIAYAIQFGYYAQPTVGSGHTFTISTTSGAYTQFCIYVVSGVTGLYDASSYQTTSNGGSGTTTCQTAAINPGSGTHVVLAAVVDEETGGPGTSSMTINSGYTLDNALLGVGGSYVAIGTGHLIQSPGASTQPTWSIANNGNVCAIMSLH